MALGIAEHTPLFVHDRLLGRDERRVVHRLHLPVSTCSVAAPVVLPQGYRLIVWWPGDHEPQKVPLDGQADQ